MRRPLGLLPPSIAAAFAIAAPAANANYYGIAQLRGGNFHGTQVTLRSNVLTVPNLNADFANNDSWVVDSTAARYWVEAGIIHGTYCCNNYAASPSFFWADSRPNGGGFHSHQGGSAALNTYYNDKIRYQGSGAWTVEVGSLAGTSTSNITSSTFVETGTEVTTKSATACSSQSNLAWYDQNGGFHTTWTTSIENAGRHTDNPPYAYWVDPQNWLRDYINTSC